MRSSETNTGTSKKTQDLIFGTIVFVGALLVFMFIYSTTLGTRGPEEFLDEPALSPNHEESLHVGTNIPSEEREKAAHGSSEAKKAMPYGETKWNKKEVNRELDKKSSTYEREEKVVRPEKTGGVL